MSEFGSIFMKLITDNRYTNKLTLSPGLGSFIIEATFNLSLFSFHFNLPLN